MTLPPDEGNRIIEEVRTIALGFPEVVERLSHGAPTFFIRGKKVLAHVFQNHHGDGRLAMWCAAPPGVQAELVEQEPDRFFVPPYVGHRGWIGLRLDVEPDVDEIAEILEDAYRLVAPKTLVRQLDAVDGDRI
ncbi:MAG: MmcQ/YjbR family DNA-binding protein [Acidimicrobiales bacterium]